MNGTGNSLAQFVRDVWDGKIPVVEKVKCIEIPLTEIVLNRSLDIEIEHGLLKGQYHHDVHKHVVLVPEDSNAYRMYLGISIQKKVQNLPGIKASGMVTYNLPGLMTEGTLAIKNLTIY